MRSEGLRTLALGALLAAGCARIQAPPGGPPDTVPPRVVSARPAPGSLDQPGDVRIELLFDEYVDRTSTVSDLVFNPSPPGHLRTSWRGRRLVVRFDEDLPTDTSWLLELGTGCRDLSGNRMSAPFRLPFSTGSELDTLEVSGTIHGLAAGDWAELWAWPSDQWPSRAWVDPPRRTRPDSDGRFRLLGLDDRGWRLLAVLDANRDGRWTPNSERAALASTDGRPGARQPISLRIGPDLLLDSLRLGRGQFVDPWSLALEARLDAPALLGLSALERRSPAGDSLRLAPLRLERMDGVDVPLLGLRPEAGGWLLALGEAADSVGHRLLLPAIGDTLLVRPPASLTEPPVPGENPTFAREEGRIVLQVDRALLALDGEPRQALDGDTLPLPATLLSPFRVAVQPGRPGGRALLPSGWLRLAGDLAWPDSLVAKSLPGPVAERVVGALEWSFDREPYDPLWRLVWTDGAGAERETQLLREGRLDGLAEGPARLAFYQDRNRNGQWDPGLLAPWQAAELWIALPDTFDVVAGWTVGGIELSLPVEIP